jgi:uncharacterized protein (TIGR03435 family)
VVLSAAATAQNARLEFEVASVKLDKTNNGSSGGCHGVDSSYTPTEAATAPPLGRCVVNSARIGHLIGIASELPMRMIEGEPDWPDGSDRFNIEAVAEQPAKSTHAQLLVMLQTLLVDRFPLKFRRETVEQAGFVLVVGKSGSKMKPAKGKEVLTSFGGQIKPAPERGTLTARKITIRRLAEILAFIRLAPVVDKTDLDAEYDLTLHWDEDEGPTLRTALEEQLGLKLEPQKVPVSLFVIESAQKPSPN